MLDAASDGVEFIQSASGAGVNMTFQVFGNYIDAVARQTFGGGIAGEYRMLGVRIIDARQTAT